MHWGFKFNMNVREQNTKANTMTDPNADGVPVRGTAGPDVDEDRQRGMDTGQGTVGRAEGPAGHTKQAWRIVSAS
jgi:hypothetical protein